jgi:hypothetical protein
VWIVDSAPGDGWEQYPAGFQDLLAERYEYQGQVAFATLYRLRSEASDR